MFIKNLYYRPLVVNICCLFSCTSQFGLVMKDLEGEYFWFEQTACDYTVNQQLDTWKQYDKQNAIVNFHNIKI